MWTQEALLARGREACGSWYRLAQRSGLTRATVSHLVRGRVIMSADSALKIATAAGVDAVEAVAGIEAERAEKTGSISAPIWRQIAERVASTARAAAVVAVVISLSLVALTPRIVEASACAGAAFVKSANLHYAYLARFLRRVMPRWFKNLGCTLAGVA